MKNGYTTVRRLKLTPFELRVAIDALNAKRLKQKASGIDNRQPQIEYSTCSMLLKLNYIRLIWWFTPRSHNTASTPMGKRHGEDSLSASFFS